MTRNLNTQNLGNSKPKNTKNEDSLNQKGVCYRGFTSIDQEMEREIALQWFKPTGKSRSHGNFLFRGRP
jgi:hypothetical protein